MTTKYRKKPVVIEAMQLTFQNQDEVKAWVGRGKTHSTPPMRAVTGIAFAINMIALFGDWIIRDDEGTFSICKPDIFEKTYEAVNEQPSKEPEAQADIQS